MVTYPILRLYILNETVEFRDQDIVEATVTQEINPLSMELPAARADITIHTTSPDFEPFSHGRYYQALSANTAIDLLESVDGAEKYVGRFYLDEWDNPSEGILSLSLQDAIGVMDNIPFDGIFYDSLTSVKTIIEDLAIYAPCPISVDSALDDTKLTGYIKGNITLRQALQQVCFAAGAYASTQESDQIQILPTYLPKSYAILQGAYYDNAAATYDTTGVLYSDCIADDTITKTEKLDRQKLRILPMVTDIELITHDYVKSPTKETIFSDTLEPGNYKIIFDKPYGDVIIWGAGDVPEALGTEYETEEGVKEVLITEAGGTYPDVTIIGKTGTYTFGPNSVNLSVMNAGLVTVEGYPYNDNTQALTWFNPKATQDYIAGAIYDNAASTYDNPKTLYWREWTIQAPPNTWKITDGTLVDKTVGPGLLDRLVEYANTRHEQTITALPEKEIRPGGLYILDSLYDKTLVAGAETITKNLTGGNLKETRLVGVEKLEN